MAVSSGLCFFSPPTAPFPVTFPSSRICRPALVNGRFPSSSMSQLFDSKLSVMIRTQTTPTHSWGPQLTVCKVHPGDPAPQFKLPGCINNEVIDSSKYIGKCPVVLFCCPDDNSDKKFREYFSAILEKFGSFSKPVHMIDIASPKDCPNTVKEFVKHVVPPSPDFLSIACDNGDKVRKEYGVLCALINKGGIVEFTVEGEGEHDVKDALKVLESMKS